MIGSDDFDRNQFAALHIRILLIGFPLLAAGESAGMMKGYYGGWVLLLLLLLDPLLLYLLARAIYWGIERSATGFTTMVYAGRGHPLQPAHSGIESLEARGFYPEAAEGWRSHLAQHPGDHAARFKLAALYRSHLDNPAAAEALYLEVRKGQPNPTQERHASNLLIDLYQATGRRDRQLVELARFADRWKGTTAGADAARTLKELKRE